jgi:hypothetical protein
MESHRSGCRFAALIEGSRVRSLRELEDGLFVRAQFFCKPRRK